MADFNIRSEITTNDANWWDRLHYRLPIAERVVANIERAHVHRQLPEPQASYIKEVVGELSEARRGLVDSHLGTLSRYSSSRRRSLRLAAHSR